MTTPTPARGTDRYLDFTNAQGQRFRMQVEDDPVDACSFTVRVIPLLEPASPAIRSGAASQQGATAGYAAGILACLTARERDVAALIAEGFTNDQIALRLYISRSTVKTHLQNIYAKVHVRNRTALVALLHGAC